MSDAIDVRAYKAHQAREAAFEQWWKLSRHNGTLPEHREALAREAYFAAWGRAARLPDREGWQDISTAPKDGTKIDLWHPTRGRLVDAFWNKRTYVLYEPWGWGNASWGRITGATHWRPLPQEPNCEQQ